MDIPVVLYAFLGGGAGWAGTTAGAAFVFFFKRYDQRVLNIGLGLASGLMMAAVFLGLITPAMDYAQEMYDSAILSVLLVAGSFFAGGLIVTALGKIISQLPAIQAVDTDKQHSLKRSFVLVSAITFHNFPEGLIIGAAFGAYGLTVLSGNPDPKLLTSALALSAVIGIQDIPEGLTVSLPLRREGVSRMKSFLYGSASAIVEPLGAALAALIVIQNQAFLSISLALSGGMMFFVVLEDLIPEAHKEGHTHGHWVTVAAMLGFCMMMLLEAALTV